MGFLKTSDQTVSNPVKPDCPIHHPDVSPARSRTSSTIFGLLVQFAVHYATTD